MEVDEEDVGHDAADLRARFLQGVGRLRAEALSSHDLGQAEDEVHVVVNEQCVRHHPSRRLAKYSRLRGAKMELIDGGAGVQEASHGAGALGGRVAHDAEA